MSHRFTFLLLFQLAHVPWGAVEINWGDCQRVKARQTLWENGWEWLWRDSEGWIQLVSLRSFRVRTRCFHMAGLESDLIWFSKVEGQCCIYDRQVDEQVLMPTHLNITWLLFLRTRLACNSGLLKYTIQQCLHMSHLVQSFTCTDTFLNMTSPGEWWLLFLCLL